MSTHATAPEEPTEALVGALQIRLMRLSYPALSLCLQRVLSDLDLTGVRSLGRNHFRGRIRFGGADLYGNTSTPLGTRAVLIQIKRYIRPVPRHYVDELRGVMLRYGIAQGLLVTTSTFSAQARAAANGFRGRPIRLIDGLELARLMIEHRIGVREQENLITGKRTWVVDEEAFAFLRRFAYHRYLTERKEERALGRRA